MKLDIIPTLDGSPTLYSHTYQDTYHSRHGAVQEAMHIFIPVGKKCRRILEIGFGTGLNAVLTFMHATGPLTYTSIEKHPLEKPIWQQLDYPIDQTIFQKIHEAVWHQDVEIRTDVFLHKKKMCLKDVSVERAYDGIYFDAFSPSVQPELWTRDIFQKMYDCLMPEGFLVTYSAKGSVRRHLTEAGFQVKRMPGPPGKREYLCAQK